MFQIYNIFAADDARSFKYPPSHVYLFCALVYNSRLYCQKWEQSSGSKLTNSYWKSQDTHFGLCIYTVHLRQSVCPSITLRFGTITRRHIAVCQVHICAPCHGVCYIVFDTDGMLFDFFAPPDERQWIFSNAELSVICPRNFSLKSLISHWLGMWWLNGRWFLQIVDTDSGNIHFMFCSHFITF